MPSKLIVISIVVTLVIVVTIILITKKKITRDCVLRDNLRYNSCTENKQTLTLDISSSQGLFGKSCESIIKEKYPQYSSVFKKQGSSYVADVTCNDCELELVSGTTAPLCLGGKAKYEYKQKTSPSVYGKSCSDVAAEKYPSAIKDSTNNTYYYYADGCSNTAYRSYGFISNDNQKVYTQGIAKVFFGLCFDSNKLNVIGFYIDQTFISSFINYSTNIVNNIQVGPNKTIYNNPGSMEFPIIINTDPTYIEIKAKDTVNNQELTKISWNSTQNITLTLGLFNKDGSQIKSTDVQLLVQ